MMSYIEALFTSPHHEVALMYTDLTNSFDILSSFNITLHNPISFIAFSTMQRYFAAFMS